MSEEGWLWGFSLFNGWGGGQHWKFVGESLKIGNESRKSKSGFMKQRSWGWWEEEEARAMSVIGEFDMKTILLCFLEDFSATCQNLSLL